MAELLPVLEAWTLAEPSVSWPYEVAGRWLVLDQTMTAEQVGGAVRVLAARNRADADARRRMRRWSRARAVPAEQMTAERAIELICDPAGFPGTAGGLLVRHEEFVAAPGCCCDVANWRDWYAALDGGFVETGHDVTTVVENVGDRLRVWADVLDVEAPIPPGTPHIEFPRAELAGMLDAARLRLSGFRDRAVDWAREHAPSAALRLGTALDRGLEIPAPELGPTG